MIPPKIPSSQALAVLSVVTVLAACGPSDESTAPAVVIAPDLHGAAEAFAGASIAQLSVDATALEVGSELFAARCAACHGADGRGKAGVMDLVNGVFNHGDDIGAIGTTIAAGRHNTMPAFGRELGEMALSWMAEYLDSLGSDEPPSRFAERGAEQFVESCAVCHGADARGNHELGASNLADDYWLHSDETMGIRQIVMRGVDSVCPAQSDALSETEIALLTAYVADLRRTKR